MGPGGQGGQGLLVCIHPCAHEPGPQTPSSDFWKELQLALPRKVQYRPVQGDPQTQLQDDKDPMLIVQGRVAESRALERELDPDPEGDLGMSTQTHYYDCLSLWRCLDPRPPWELPGLLVPLWLGVSREWPPSGGVLVKGSLWTVQLQALSYPPHPGVRGPVFGEPPAPVHASGVLLGEGRGSEMDVSDLGSRNYSARTDFYCLVSEDDV